MRKIFEENHQKLKPWIQELELFLDIFNNSLTLVDNRFNEEFYFGNLLCWLHLYFDIWRIEMIIIRIFVVNNIIENRISDL